MIQGAARPQLPSLQPQPCALVMIAGGTGIIRAATRSFLADCLFSHTRALSLSLSLSFPFSLRCHAHAVARTRLQGLCLGRGALVVRCRFFVVFFFALGANELQKSSKERCADFFLQVAPQFFGHLLLRPSGRIATGFADESQSVLHPARRCLCNGRRRGRRFARVFDIFWSWKRKNQSKEHSGRSWEACQGQTGRSCVFNERTARFCQRRSSVVVCVPHSAPSGFVDTATAALLDAGVSSERIVCLD